MVAESQAAHAIRRAARHLRAAAVAAGEGRHVAEARVRPIESIGVELRFEWNGEVRVSQIFKSWEELKAKRMRSAASFRPEAGTQSCNPAADTGRLF